MKLHEIKNMEMLKDVKDSFDSRIIAALRQTEVTKMRIHIDTGIPHA